VLILGSGNLVHNLRAYAWGQPEGTAPPFDWAVRFEDRAKELLLGGDYRALADWQNLGAEARLAIPTPDHYLPLLYVLGAGEGAGVTLPVEGIEGGSISMLGVQLG